MTLPVRPLVVAAAVVVALVAVYVVYTSTIPPGPVTTTVPTSFTVNGGTYTFTYTATNEAEREAGLMNKEVTDTTTMLFAFPSSGLWDFWMYDTNTSLDMVWVNATGSTGTVVYLVTSAQPCYNSDTCTIYHPTSPANYVIEAKAGFAAANGISIGTTVQFA